MTRKYSLIPLLAVVSCLFSTLPAVAQSMLSKGAEAPRFTAEAALDGSEFEFSLPEALDRGPVVLYFFPAAYTKGCDLEAHTFAERKDEFTAAGATVIGISADDIERLKSFSSDPDYCAGKFPVASDPEGNIAADYGLELIPPRPGATDVEGKEITHGFIPRTTFVIDEEGTIEAVFSSQIDQIAPDEHVNKALALVQGM